MMLDRSKWLSSHRIVQVAFVAALAAVACGSGAGNGGTSTGGNGGSGSGQGGSGGTSSGAGGHGTGGASSVGGTGGASATGGTAGSGGTSGADSGVDGSATGGAAAGGAATGGAATGGAATGGAAAGGAAGGGAGGTTTVGPDGGVTDRVRTIIPFNAGWLFHYGDATGASAATFADTGWRSLNVPHDWAIEGPTPPSNPFSQTAATTGRGAYVSSGISWYRKHFTLPSADSGDRVFIEFDGVMSNSQVYVNGTAIGNHPYPWVSFRYDITSSVHFGGADNVIAVETNTTTQPAERFYDGAGIYRDVRLIATNSVHVDQYATFVTTPSPTAASATVHVTTSVVNSGTASQSVTVQGIVSDPTGTALPAVSAAAQTIAAGASATFTLSVPVTNPKLWALDAPNMYQLLTNVQVGGTTVDDDVTAFGIRDVVFNGGLTINGKSVKLQGVAIHQDYHGLGVAAPQRAEQRRLAKLKTLGVNAIRTAHNPPGPSFLDLTDRMGILVLDELTDVWTGHKYADVGDYSKYFNQAATTPTGMPAIPAGVTGVTEAGATWWQVDMTGWIMRDRNHPSVLLYSMGNEIHDAIGTRTPILTKMVALSHALDSSRYDTQALLDPATSGDYPGPTQALLDVWGDNYNVGTCLAALPGAPTKSGLITEDSTPTGDWAKVKANAGLIGEFLWTGVDYLGEANSSWPVVGNAGDLPPVQEGGALEDELGNIYYPTGSNWQTAWGVPATPRRATGTTASKIVLTSDHTTLLTDPNDIVFVEAAITDASGGIVTTSSTPVTFAITGPGSIVAVDSGSMTQETFRGTVRNAYLGLAYALVQATAAGTITVTASATGLTGASVPITATAGAFVPCSGTCD